MAKGQSEAMATTDRCLAALLQEDDAASCVAEKLDPISSTRLRGVCHAVCEALTSTAWAQQLWRQQCVDATAVQSAADAATVAASGCQFVAFTMLHGPAHMRNLRTERLAQALHERDARLTLREDSWLCNSYIAGRPQAGSLENVVDGMEAMAFLFRETAYAEERDEVMQERWAAAVSMAGDAARDGASGVLLPMHFHLPLDPAEISARAKRRAVEAWLRAARGRLGHWEAVRRWSASRAPRGLQHAVAALVRGDRDAAALGQGLRGRGSCAATDDAWGGALPPSPYDSYETLGETERRRCRAEVRRLCEARDSAEETALRAHLHALRTVAEDAARGREHLFPPTLTKRQRAALHDEAEELGLAHESRGIGVERRLVVWSV